MPSKEEYIEKTIRDYLNGDIKLEDFVSNHFELKEKYSKILDDVHDYRFETHCMKMTIRNLCEHFGVESEKELQNIYLNNNLNEVIEAQKTNLTNSYMIGLYNGLVTAKAILLNNNDNLKLADNTIYPYKFEDLKESMWVYDIKYDEFCRIDFIAGIYPHRSYSDGTCEDGAFEDDRFYPVEYANEVINNVR